MPSKENSEQAPLSQVKPEQDTISSEQLPNKKQQNNKKVAQTLKIPILIFNIIGTACVFSQGICSILRSVDGLQSSKPKFQDIQTLIISFFISVAELFIFLVIITKRKLRLKLESWFTLTKSIHSYFVVQILFSFIQGPQDIFPSPGTTVLPNVFYTTYNTALSYLLIAGWICNTVAYLLYMVAAANRKTQYKAAKKAGAESEVIQLY